MSKKHGDKLSWDGGEISYSAPAPGAMQIHTDTDCNQSLYSKEAASSAPDTLEGSVQVRLIIKHLLLSVFCNYHFGFSHSKVTWA